jgi:SAM-dependent methyltransferase
MSNLTDQRYLRSEQYRDAANLDARIRLHARFSTNPSDLQRWIFDRLDLPARSRILELGCGPASLWRANAERFPPGWSLTLADLSPGMAREARGALGGLGLPAAYLCADAQAIPCAGARFDAVLANHMLYHVPDRAAAVAEIARVLRPDGRCYAATNGEGHLAELHALVARFDPALRLWGGRAGLSFSLQNGAEQLAARFGEVRLERYEDGLAVTESAPLAAYIASVVRLDPPRRRDLERFVEAELAAQGGTIRITKDAGLLTALRPHKD